MSATPYWFEHVSTKELRRLVADAKNYLAYATAQGFDTEPHQTDFYLKRRALRKRERAEKKGTVK